MHRWIERPVLIVFPLAGLLAGSMLAVAWRQGRDRWLFPCAAAIFASAFGTLAVSFLPYMVPFTITVEQAAAPMASLEFMFWGAGIVVLPLTLLYTGAVYFIFRGKVDDDVNYGHLPTAPVPTSDFSRSRAASTGVPAQAAASPRTGEAAAEKLLTAAYVLSLAWIGTRKLLGMRRKNTL